MVLADRLTALLVAACLLAAGCGLAAAAELPVASTESPAQGLAEAIASAKDGDVIEVMAGDYKGLRLVLENRRLTLRGVGDKAPVFDGEGKLGAAKALLLVRGGEVTVENIEFRGSRSNQTDGAGIRLEGGKLTLRRCRLYDNEYGLSTSNDPTAEVRIEDSEFGKAPRTVGGLYHLLTVGRIGSLTVSGSRFQQGFEGHLIRSRARETTLSYNIIHDGPTGGASYEVELPAGGVATLIGNVIGQGSETQNPVVVAYGSEGQAWERNSLYMAHNTLLSYRWLPAWFLRVFSDRLPENTEVVAINNLTVGPGLFSWGASGRFEGNGIATFGMLRDADTYGFELPPASYWRGKGVDPRDVGGRDLSPKAEFKWPTGTQPLAPIVRWSPGAYQR
jgi:hypothetical protein